MTKQTDIFSRSSVRRALKCLDNLSKLDRHPLTTLNIVQKRHQTMGRYQTTADLGVSLREILRDAVEKIKLDEKEEDYTNSRWWPYLILRDEYTKHLGPQFIASTLGDGIALRTYHYHQAKAIDRVGSQLRLWEEENNESSIPPKKPVVFLAPPQPAHTIIGRYHLLESLKHHLFTSSTVALCALNGIPGVGKTTLALTLAHAPDVLAHFADGVLWAGLGRKPDVMALLGSWGRALGLAESALVGHTTVAERAKAVQTAIGTRRFLLVIDDAWALEDALAFQVGGPNCVHLLTTRHPHLARDFAEAGAYPIEELSQPAGLMLFNHLAPEIVEMDPDFANSLVTIAGGLPLAIILMARYVRRTKQTQRPFQPQHLLTQLQQTTERLKLDMPQSPIHSHPSLPTAAHISLAAIIEISVSMLEDTTQQLLYTLVMLPPKPNTFPREAALAISETAAQNLELLINAGLVEEVGNGRYTLHQTIADYARLQPIDLQAQQQLVTYFTDYVMAHEHDYKPLDLEQNNIRVALETAERAGLPEAFILGATAFSSFLRVRGLYTQAEGYLSQAQEMSEVSGNASHLALCFLNQGYLLNAQGQSKKALEHLHEGLKALHTLSQVAPAILADFHHVLAASYSLGATPEQAIVHQKKALEICRTLNDKPREAKYIGNLGTHYLYAGQFEEAKKYHRQAIAIGREVGDLVSVARHTGNLGGIHHGQGKSEKARDFYQKALTLSRELQDRPSEGSWLGHLGTAYRDLGDPAKAIALLNEALTISREVGARSYESSWLGQLGRIYRDLGEIEVAINYLEQALALSQAINSRRQEGHWLGFLGTVYQAQGQLDLAIDYYQKALAISQEIKDYRHGGIWLGYRGTACCELGQIEQGIAYLKEALAISQEVGDGRYKPRWQAHLETYENQDEPNNSDNPICSPKTDNESS